MNNVQTTDGYSAPRILSCQGAKRLMLHARQTPGVSGSGAIYYELGLGTPTPVWQGEVFMPPGTISRAVRFDAVRVRSAAPGKPASVTVDAS